MSEKIQLNVIPPGSVMTIEIDTDLYIRLQQLLIDGLPYKDLSHFQEILKKVHDNKADDDPLAYSAHTILWLIHLVEESARSSGIIQQKDFDPDSQKIVE